MNETKVPYPIPPSNERTALVAAGIEAIIARSKNNWADHRRARAAVDAAIESVVLRFGISKEQS